jgi:predicted DNA-binding protein (MmcQ/YjbR family)
MPNLRAQAQQAWYARILEPLQAMLMTDKYSKYQIRLSKKLDVFNAKYMSNSKWIKLFNILSLHSDLVSKCLIKDVWDDVLREVNVPSIDEFSIVFNAKGINDVMRGGPTEFKEIEWVEFPSEWKINRPMGTHQLEPFTYHQNILAM